MIRRGCLTGRRWHDVESGLQPLATVINKLSERDWKVLKRHHLCRKRTLLFRIGRRDERSDRIGRAGFHSGLSARRGYPQKDGKAEAWLIGDYRRSAALGCIKNLYREGLINVAELDEHSESIVSVVRKFSKTVHESG